MSFDIDDENGQSVSPVDDSDEYTADYEDHDMDIIKYTRTCGEQTQTVSDWMYLWLIKPRNLGRHFETSIQAIQYVQDITMHMNRRDLHVWCRQVGICKLSSSQLKTHLQILLLQENDDTGELDIDYDATYMPASFKHSETQDWFCTLARGDYESHDYVGGQWIIREGLCNMWSGDEQCVITCAHNGRDMHHHSRESDHAAQSDNPALSLLVNPVDIPASPNDVVNAPLGYQLGDWNNILDTNSYADQ